MSTLTDRYVYAVVRSVPEAQREDIERELRASIDDDIDARIGSGLDAKAAEHATLVALGDPAQLAANYAGRTNSLIGPRYYFDYLRLLKLLVAIVLPISVVGVVLARLIAGDGVGEVIGGTVTLVLTVTVQLAFWVTLVFVVLERTDRGSKTRGIEWTPDYLPTVPDPKAGAGLGELIASAVFLVLFAGAIVWQQYSSVFVDAEGAPIPLLQAQLWSFWIPYAFVLIALELVFAVLLYARRRWSWGMAAVNVVLSIAFVVPALMLTLSGDLVNPEFLERFNWPTEVISPVLGPVLVVVFGGIAAWDMIDGFLKAGRASRAR